MARDFYPTYKQGTLHPESEAILARVAEAKSPPLYTMRPADARKAFFLPAWLGEPREEVTVSETVAGDIPIRIFTPQGEGPLPVLVFFHGGGFVLGDLDGYKPFCTFLSAGAQCIVASVGYRLAPEDPYPAAPDDAWAATRWVAAHAPSFGGDPARLAVGGDSAGGNLAAVVSILARDHGAPKICQQVLICPWVDLSPESDSADSFRHFGQGLWLSAESLHWSRVLYLQDQDRFEDPRVSPLRAPDLSSLPPALVLISEFDLLADQCRSYARRLEAAGVPVTERFYPGMLHDFVVFPALFPSAWKAIDEISASLQKAFARP